jgi:hypothetical protein
MPLPWYWWVGGDTATLTEPALSQRTALKTRRLPQPVEDPSQRVRVVRHSWFDKVHLQPLRCRCEQNFATCHLTLIVLDCLSNFV